MSIASVRQRLASFASSHPSSKYHALKEVAQEIAIFGLSQTDFFKRAAFAGGTSLRMFWGLERFSEDLDFSVLHPDSDFVWSPYLQQVQKTLAGYGFSVKITDRSEVKKNAVKVAFLKDDSVGKVLTLDNAELDKGWRPKTIKIKLEIDTNAPTGSTCEQKYTSFPLLGAVTVHDLASLFAGKSHALLCRKWAKGRDWYDFLWYTASRAPLNYRMLSAALNQQGPWAGQKIVINRKWVLQQLEAKICAVDWPAQVADVERFLKDSDRPQLKLWGTDLFLGRLKMLESYLPLR